MTDQALHEKIEAYLLGELPPEAAAAFETEIAADPQLAEEVELQRLILPVPDRLAELDLRTDFQRWRHELDTGESPPGPAPKPPSPKPWPWILATLLLLAGAFWLWMDFNNRLQQERLRRETAEKALETEKLLRLEAENEKNRLLEDLIEQQKQNGQKSAPAQKTTSPPPIAQVPDLPEYLDLADTELLAYAATFDETVRGTKSTGNPAENRITEANKAISKKQFQLAASLLEKIGKDDSQYATAQEMLAYVYAKQRRVAKALQAYRVYMPFDSDTEKHQWNLCLFYLVDYPKYRTEFQTEMNKILGDSGHPYFSRASDLRTKLTTSGVWK